MQNPSSVEKMKKSTGNNLKGSVKFAGTRNNEFFPVLKKRLDEYFGSNNISKYGNTSLVIKTVILSIAYVIPFACILLLQPGWAVSMALWAIMGFGMAGLGMSVMHDGNHGSYSSSKSVNWLMAHILNLMGGSTYNWKLQHNILHHTYTNVTGMDDDIAPKPALRLSPHDNQNFSHRFQWIHAFVLYGLTTLFWVTAKDFIQYARYKKNNVSSASDNQHRLILFKIILLKIVYFSVFLVVPVLLLSIPFAQVLTGFIIMHFIAGLVLTVIFQLAHSLEGTHHPIPKNGVLENDWAIHQMSTTMNFSPDNKFLSWYVGGLNYQVEHHLFPRISHVHYPAISKIVRNTAEEYNIPYLQHSTLGKAIAAHIYFLKKLGKVPSLDEAIG